MSVWVHSRSTICTLRYDIGILSISSLVLLMSNYSSKLLVRYISQKMVGEKSGFFSDQEHFKNTIPDNSIHNTSILHERPLLMQILPIVSDHIKIHYFMRKYNTSTGEHILQISLNFTLFNTTQHFHY